MARSDLTSPTTWGAVRASINAMFTEVYAAIAGYGTKGAANGVASLDGSGHVPTAQLSIASTNLTDSTSLERVVGTFASSAALQTAFPAASNTGSKALVGSAAPYTDYSSNGVAWIKKVSASTDLTDSTSLARIVGTFASSAALQTAFPAASNAGSKGLVGSAAPYASYTSDGTAWNKTVLASTDLTDGAALNTAVSNNTTAIASSLKAPTSWAASAGGGTPTLTSGTAVLGTAYKNTTAGLTTFTTPIDSIPFVAKDDVLVCLASGTYTYSPAGSGYPIAISTATTLADAHNGANLVCTSTPALTVNSGRVFGFGCSIKGAFTTAGTAAFNDLRTTTGTAFCSMVQSDATGAGATYDLVGTK